jgi:hypothetical protein
MTFGLDITATRSATQYVRQAALVLMDIPLTVEVFIVGLAIFAVVAGIVFCVFKSRRDKRRRTESL